MQIPITNKSTSTHRVLLTSFVMEDQTQRVRVEALDPNQRYELGRHGYGTPVGGLTFGEILSLPSLIMTMNANNRLREDGIRRRFMDAL